MIEVRSLTFGVNPHRGTDQEFSLTFLNIMRQSVLDVFINFSSDFENMLYLGEQLNCNHDRFKTVQVSD